MSDRHLDLPRRVRLLQRCHRSVRAFSSAAVVSGLLVSIAGCAPEASSREAAELAVQAQELDLPPAIIGAGEPPRGETVQYVPSDPTARGYLSVPAGEGPFPAVILIHEWNGLVDRVRQVADALADEGYVALAADLYHGRTGSNRDENIALMSEARGDPDGMIANLDAAVVFLRARPDVTGKVAAMGWCFGGGVALSFALGGENHEGTAIFYGRLVEDPEVLASLTHEVYGTFGRNDTGPSPQDVERFAAALDAAGIQNDLHIYDDVGHGFWLWVDRDPANASAPAADAWTRLKAYLQRVLS